MVGIQPSNLSLTRWGEARRCRYRDTAGVPAAHLRRLFVGAAAAISAAVFVAFLLWEHPGLGIGHFYYLAIALVALALGPVWGAAAGGFGAGLYALGVVLNQALPTSEIVTSSMPIRLITYVAIGALLGWFAAHYRAANEELQILAQRDLVTGLPNTRAFERAIDRRLADGEPFALLVGDLDSLRSDEDRDAALRRASDALSGALGADSDVARVGSEEFAVLTACDSVEQAGQLAVWLERNLCESGSLVTFGWSAFPREGENALTLYRAADERLYARRILREPRNGLRAVGV
jgi:diguanylate cyclase (GGDEF)-like protein